MFTMLGGCHISRSNTPSSFASLVTGAKIFSLHQWPKRTFLGIPGSIMLTDFNANVFSAKGKFYLAINVTVWPIVRTNYPVH